MIERFGDVLYWLGLIVAAAFVVVAAIRIDDGIVMVFSLGAALASYLIGRAFRYVLAAR